MAVGALTLNFSDADLSEITNYWKLDAFAHDIGESYRYSCTEARVGNIPSQRMEIFFVAEAGRRDNSPLVRPGRPKEGGLRIEVVLDQPAFSAEKVLTPEPVGAQQNTGDADPTATSLLDPETAPFTDAELHDLVQDWGGSGRGGTGEDTQPAPVQGRLRYGATSVCVITGAGITIGRAPTCDLVLTHKSVSRQHARIYKAAQGWYLSPIDSHRCIINGQTIYEEAPIQEGDSLRFGAISDSYTFEEVQQ
ncbi:MULTISPECIES: FHA domain-containing protein [unclassified Paenarthrobacter]|uniref:FHA domain-containing protein n=1 Tax=unclassified Paenarthrobacter TaxID=2634190 RepID=UPI003CEBFF80